MSCGLYMVVGLVVVVVRMRRRWELGESAKSAVYMYARARGTDLRETRFPTETLVVRVWSPCVNMRARVFRARHSSGRARGNFARHTVTAYFD